MYYKNGQSTFLENLREKSFAVAVDAHTAGEPIRVILDGHREELESQPTMVDRQKWIRKNQDEFRTRTMQEPRGHAAMFGAIVMSPTREEADIGVLFPYPAGYADMCGHGSMGVATVLLELGYIDAEEGENRITLDTPAGLVDTVAHYHDGKVDKVDLFGTPSFFVKSIDVRMNDGEKVKVDLSYGGNFFGIVSVKQFGLSVAPEDLGELNRIAHQIMKAINHMDSVRLEHPKTGHIQLERIRFVEGDHSEKNVVIHEGGVIDRSPCGTGTCSQLAWEWERGKIETGDTSTYRSIIDTKFRGEVAEKKVVDGRDAIVPKVTGSSYITGLNYFVASRGDLLVDGFFIPHE